MQNPHNASNHLLLILVTNINIMVYIFSYLMKLMHKLVKKHGHLLIYEITTSARWG